MSGGERIGAKKIGDIGKKDKGELEKLQFRRAISSLIRKGKRKSVLAF